MHSLEECATSAKVLTQPIEPSVKVTQHNLKDQWQAEPSAQQDHKSAVPLVPNFLGHALNCPSASLHLRLTRPQGCYALICDLPRHALNRPERPTCRPELEPSPSPSSAPVPLVSPSPASPPRPRPPRPLPPRPRPRGAPLQQSQARLACQAAEQTPSLPFCMPGCQADISASVLRSSAGCFPHSWDCKAAGW